MLTETIEIILDSINTSNKTISIAKDTIIKKDGIEIAAQRDRRAFTPGDLELVKDYMGLEEGAEITYLESIWTQEVIDNYLASLGQ